MSKWQAGKVWVAVNAIEMRRNKGAKKLSDRMCQCFTSFFMYLDWEFQLDIYYGRMVSSSLWISVDKQMCSRCNEYVCTIYQFWSCESKQYKNVPTLSFATGPSLNLSERQSIISNHDENNYWGQQMLNGQYIKMSVNGVSMICGLVSMVIEQSFGRCYA